MPDRQKQLYTKPLVSYIYILYIYIYLHRLLPTVLAHQVCNTPPAYRLSFYSTPRLLPTAHQVQQRQQHCVHDADRKKGS